MLHPLLNVFIVHQTSDIMAMSGKSSLLENVYPTWHYYFCIYMYEADGSRITVDSKIDENRCKQKKMNKSC